MRYDVLFKIACIQVELDPEKKAAGK